MQAFVQLVERLDQCRGTRERVQAIATYFQTAEPVDAAWALFVLQGGQRRRLITGRRLRQICLEGSSLPDWLFEDCYAHVGDSAETIALLWQQRQPPSAEAHTRSCADSALHHWMEVLLPAAAASEGEEQVSAVQRLWEGLDPSELLVANKLLTGGLRVGVAQGLVVKALSQISGLDAALITHRLMGGFQPQAAAFNAVLAPADQNDGVPSRPYPFFLASPLPPPAAAQENRLPGLASDWMAEWKWDGIRGQIIRRQGESYLWSRGEELIQTAFPELAAAAAALPDGSVLDGEVLIWPSGADQPASFSRLQQRLGRKAPSRRHLSDHPATFIAYDLLERDGDDWRTYPLQQRREALEDLLAPLAEQGRLRLSPALPMPSWPHLESLRGQARSIGAEGVMLKAKQSPYLVGRRRGFWWKHKLEPQRLDAVLLYAQAGSGRRANLFTDYTFGLWDDDGRLVSFAKAYSGLTDAEITKLDRWIRSHTLERYGPVRAVEPLQVFELAFEGIQPSKRHKSGLAVRFPRISRWRADKPAAEADTLAGAKALLQP
jgi:DNA ligase-1